VLGREAMSALETLTNSRAWGKVSAVMKGWLANALASGDTFAIVESTSRAGASAAAAQSTSTGDEQEPPALPYRQATAQRQ